MGREASLVQHLLFDKKIIVTRVTALTAGSENFAAL